MEQRANGVEHAMDGMNIVTQALLDLVLRLERQLLGCNSRPTLEQMEPLHPMGWIPSLEERIRQHLGRIHQAHDTLVNLSNEIPIETPPAVHMEFEQRKPEYTPNKIKAR